MKVNYARRDARDRHSAVVRPGVLKRDDLPDLEVVRRPRGHPRRRAGLAEAVEADRAGTEGARPATGFVTIMHRGGNAHDGERPVVAGVESAGDRDGLADAQVVGGRHETVTVLAVSVRPNTAADPPLEKPRPATGAVYVKVFVGSHRG